ncbi:MAG: hypothetical protein QIT35_gp18 [Methanophagales virus PBV299]|uniref:Uncharacterized protein n=1 Tax=Methanophagales virus PBV299 TaxID=2987730 RepID=A0ABY6GLS7_9CAUD|nr:MAG: hypothetical protein QIT35_gp18 [Methanophagales virus PBV299]UYL64814.1 MAG: hypothetical protein OFDIEDLO_00018 [Methanophagales virus PBV299]
MTRFLVEWERWADGDIRIKQVLLNDIPKNFRSVDRVRSFQIKARLRELAYLIEQCMEDEASESLSKEKSY